ncbi:MAG: zinc ribbon domain-containing protein [Candidatus Bathyarchaeia archaeon]
MSGQAFRCPYCGELVGSGDAFCGYCGRQFTQSVYSKNQIYWYHPK